MWKNDGILQDSPIAALSAVPENHDSPIGGGGIHASSMVPDQQGWSIRIHIGNKKTQVIY
jgi:hypothetical protein